MELVSLLLLLSLLLLFHLFPYTDAAAKPTETEVLQPSATRRWSPSAR